MHMPNTSLPTQVSQKPEVRGYSWWSWRRRGVQNSAPLPGTVSTPQDVTPITPVEEGAKEIKTTETENVKVNTSADSLTLSLDMREDGYVGSQTSSDEGESSKKGPSEMTQSMYGEKFRKTLRLSSDQIVSSFYYSTHQTKL